MLLWVATALATPLTDDDVLGSPTPPEQTEVVGGTPVSSGDWPDAVAVFSGEALVCSGVLVAPSVVLTAAHCAVGISHVVLNTTHLADGTGETLTVLDVISYPQWFSTYDVAVLLLAEPSSAPPRTLAADCIVDLYLQDGTPVTIVGFGAIDDNATEFTERLMEAQTTVTDADCSDAEGCLVVGGELAAGGDGVDSCKGDSGGPLYLSGPDDTYVVGLTSRPVQDFTRTCGDGGIYVRPDQVYEWIEEQAGIALPRPNCEGLNSKPRPTAAPIDTEMGRSAGTVVSIYDPNPDDHHRLSVLQAPTYGWVSFEGDLARYHPHHAWHLGEDRFVIAATDDGDPPLTGELAIAVQVWPTGHLDLPPLDLDPKACGCSATPSGLGWLWVLGLSLLTVRRCSG